MVEVVANSDTERRPVEGRKTIEQPHTHGRVLSEGLTGRQQEHSRGHERSGVLEIG